VSTTTPLKPGLLRVVSPSGALRELNAFELGVEFGDRCKSNSAPGLSSGGAIGLDVMVSNQLLSLGKTQNVAVSSAPEAVMAAPEF